MITIPAELYFNTQISLISLQAILFACYVYADTTCTLTYDNLSKPIATKSPYRECSLAVATRPKITCRSWHKLYSLNDMFAFYNP